MSDGWTHIKNRTLINFLVNSTAGTMFVKSIDASAYMKTGIKIFELLDNFVEEIGEQNIVQVVTDNGSNYVLVGKLLTAKRPHLFWTLCDAHCLDLMLKDIGKIAKVKTVIQKGISLVGFIYNHTLALNIMRKNIDNVELVRHGVTRFATTFLTLQRLHKQKTNLRKMFTSEEWLKSKAANDPKGKKATCIVLLTSFWNDIIYTLKVMGPLVQVLRLVDNEKKPAMAYIYAAIIKAKEDIRKAFNEQASKYIDVFAIIDERWKCQLHHPLHFVGYYLNPKYFYSKPEIENDPILVGGLHLCIETLSESHQMGDMTTTHLAEYKIANGLFGLGGAIRQRATLAPAEWWKTYGAQTPLLQLLAIKVLSLTCSSSGCERNWSTFEHIHSKRSRLEHKRLEDLVFVKYNQTLKERYDCRDVIEPIVLNDDGDYINEFEVRDLGEDDELVEELVYADDNLTWTDVANASEANEPMVYTRRATKEKAVASASKAIAQEAISKKVVVEEDVEEVEPIYVEDDEDEENEEYIEVDEEEEEEAEEEDYVEDHDDL
ncbi:uncharacterized protein [Cicer arietinum]|uniref:Uncharacterized protein LOC101491625 n=1 Tax=Cicer arietinum TaxID=3827 RepID=A0A1S2YVA2_CICAR|nr:uncharacterized protein LOC101491625 [Cicer arietinum]